MLTGCWIVGGKVDGTWDMIHKILQLKLSGYELLSPKVKRETGCRTFKSLEFLSRVRNNYRSLYLVRSSNANSVDMVSLLFLLLLKLACLRQTVSVLKARLLGSRECRPVKIKRVLKDISAFHQVSEFVCDIRMSEINTCVRRAGYYCF